MTSLEKQLKKLKTGPTSGLCVERDHSSLLFDKQGAASLTREDFHKLGLNGVTKLKGLDEQFDEYESELFHLSRLHFQRGMQLKEEEDELNKSLERMITRLSPYFHLNACVQVLEWLIYKYQIHLYNAELVAVAFLPYHSTNSYGRLLSILRFEKDEWEFSSSYASKGLPIPLDALLKACSSGRRDYFLVSAVSKFIKKAIKSIGNEYCEKRLQNHFKFFAILLVNLLDDARAIDDQMIARLMPHIGLALKSRVTAFKCAGLMVVAQMTTRVSLDPEVLNNIIKLMWKNVDGQNVEIILDTMRVVCQNGDV